MSQSILNSISQKISLFFFQVSVKQRASISSFCSAELKENIPGNYIFFSSQTKSKKQIFYTESESAFKQDQEQQTSPISSRRSSKQMTESDSYKLPFFHLYELIYKFRQTIINLLEQNQFQALANCLQLNKQLTSDNGQPSDFLENIERVLKDVTKILQTCLTTFQSKINDYENKNKEKEKEIKPLPEPIVTDNQQSKIIEDKNLLIIELKTKYDHMTNILNQTNIKHENEMK